MNRRCLSFAMIAVAATTQAAFGQYDGGRAVRAAYRQAPPSAMSLEDMGVQRSSGPVVYQGQPDANFMQRGAPPMEGEYMEGGHYPSGGSYGGGCADGSCGDGGCGIDGCGPGCGMNDCGVGWWGRAEYIHYWVRGFEVPALISTSPAGTAQAAAGVLPAAQVLLGNETFHDEISNSGARLTLGYWFDNCENCGLEGNVWGLEESDEFFNLTSTGTPIIARPFFNVLTNAQDAGLIAFPNIITGTVTVGSSSELFGSELNFRHAIVNDGCRRVDWMAGYRFFRLNEDLNIVEQTTAIDPQGQAAVGTAIDILDSFDTRNEFHGGQFGVMLERQRQRWGVSVLAKLALGQMQQTLSVNGSTSVTVPGGTTTTAQGGVLALGTNIREETRNDFAVMPELGFNLHCQLSDLWRANFGYTFMYVSNVIRPGDQIDTNLDPNQFPPSTAVNPRFPQPLFENDDLWIQGLTAGLECRF
jgi:hypothetical protein